MVVKYVSYVLNDRKLIFGLVGEGDCLNLSFGIYKVDKDDGFFTLFFDF